MKNLKCDKGTTIGVCPICKSNQMDDKYWPVSGTHVFTIPYECGTEIDYPIGHNGAQYGVTCDKMVKRFVMPSVKTYK